MPASYIATSLAPGSVEDLDAGSSPIAQSTPPFRPAPCRLACRNTSPLRSTPGALPYHMPMTPSCLAQRGQVVLLAAPHRGGGQVLVDAGLPVHVVLAQQRPGALQGLVEAAQRGAGVTADEGGRPQAAPPVGTDLVEQHPGQGLDTGDEDAAFGDPVLRVQVKARCGDGHGALLSAGPSSSVTSRVTLTSPCSQVSPARKHASGRSRRPAAEGPLAARSGPRQGDQLPNWCRFQPPGQFGW